MATDKGIILLSGLFARTIGKGIDKRNLEGWLLTLEPIPDELLMKAGIFVVRNKTDSFEIAPGTVFQAAIELKREEYPTELEAWRQAQRAAAYSVYGEGHASRPDVYWEDLKGPVKSVAESMGRDTLADTRTGDSTTRAHFLAEYRRILAKTTRDELKMIPSNDELLALGTTEQEALDVSGMDSTTSEEIPQQGSLPI